MQIPGYRIERLIAEGGMSSVYLATQESLERRVVIKLLNRFDRPQQAQRFVHEAKVIAALQHRHVVTIHDVGTVGERYYIAMEYLEGGSLADRIDEGMSPKIALDLLENLADCLDFLHRHNVVHRDIKPGNILFHADGTLRLADFGIALRLDEEQDAAGDRFGSPYYLSPEQVEEGPVDGRSDIYSLGIVFFQMLSGRRPYEAASPAETIVAHLSRPIPLLPEDLHPYQRLCEQMLAKRPGDRVESARNLLELIHEARALQAVQAASAHARPRHAQSPLLGRVSAAASVIVAILIGSLWWPDHSGNAQQVAPRLTTRAPITDVDTARVIKDDHAGAVAHDPLVDAEDELAVQLEMAAVQQDLPVVEPQPLTTESAVSSEASIPEEAPEVVIEVTASQPVEQPSEAEESQVPVEPVQQPINSWVQAGNDALSRDRLTTPRNDNAYSHYNKVLAHAPGNPDALSGIERIADRYAVLARRSLAARDLQQARLYLDRGLSVQADHAGLHTVSTELAMAERPPEPIQVAKIVPEPPPPEPVEIDVMEFEGTSVTSRGIRGSGNIAKDFGQLWRSVFD